MKKTIKTTRETYLSPKIEALEVFTECGFGGSGTTTSGSINYDGDDPSVDSF